MDWEVITSADFMKTFNVSSYPEGLSDWWLKRRVDARLTDLARAVDSANAHVWKVFGEISKHTSYVDFYQWFWTLKFSTHEVKRRAYQFWKAQALAKRAGFDVR
ncbi:MAG: hypothetical protein WAP23_03930 [Candidatus Spechtbacterales bacterium]